MSPKKITQPLDCYVRVSDVKGRSGESFISPTEQEERCRAAVARRGLEVGQVFHELDVSGGKMTRPLLDQAIARIESGQSAGIVVARLDRFARTLVGGIQTLEQINDLGGVVIVAEGDFELDTSTAQGELFLNMLLSFASFELRRISEKWDDAKQRAVARGIHIARHAPPGYRKRDDGRLEPHPRHAQTVRKGFEMAASGSGNAAIAAFFTRRELPSGKTLKPTWRSNRIARLLANPVYRGEARGSDTIVNPEAHKPLVDKLTWLKAQRGPAATPIKPEAKYLLSGLVRCASCRSAMRGQVPSKHAKATYRCAGQKVSGRCPHPMSVTMARLDEIVYQAFCDRIVERMLSKETTQPKTRDDSVALSALEDARESVAEVEALKGELRPAAYAQALDAALADVEAVEKELTSRQARFTFGTDLAPPTREQLATFERVRSGESTVEILRDSPVAWDITRQLLASEIQTVFVRPPVRRSKSIPVADRVKIIWRDEAEELELPIRGTSRMLEPYIWEAA